MEEFGKEEEGEGTSALDTPSVEEFVRAAHTEGITAMENPSVEEFVNEKGKGEESTAVKTSSMEECVLEAKQVEVTSSVETPPVEDFGNEKEKEHGQEKLPERVNDDNIFVQEKKHEYTAFDMQDKNFPLPVIPGLHLLRCVNILQRQSKKTTFIALKKVCKGRKRKKKEGKRE